MGSAHRICSLELTLIVVQHFLTEPACFFTAAEIQIWILVRGQEVFEEVQELHFGVTCCVEFDVGFSEWEGRYWMSYSSVDVCHYGLNVDGLEGEGVLVVCYKDGFEMAVCGVVLRDGFEC
jgi:hypothetical protein